MGSQRNVSWTRRAQTTQAGGTDCAPRKKDDDESVPDPRDRAGYHICLLVALSATAQTATQAPRADSMQAGSDCRAGPGLSCNWA